MRRCTLGMTGVQRARIAILSDSFPWSPDSNAPVLSTNKSYRVTKKYRGWIYVRISYTKILRSELPHKKTFQGKGSPYSITKRRVPELIPVLGSQPAGDVSHKLGGRLPLLSARPAVIPATLKRAATSFAAWWTEARRVWTVCLRLLPDSVAAAIWTHALLRLSPAR